MLFSRSLHSSHTNSTGWIFSVLHVMLGLWIQNMTRLILHRSHVSSRVSVVVLVENIQLSSAAVQTTNLLDFGLFFFWCHDFNPASCKHLRTDTFLKMLNGL